MQARYVKKYKIRQFLTTHLGDVIGSHHNKNGSIGQDVLIEHWLLRDWQTKIHDITSITVVLRSRNKSQALDWSVISTLGYAMINLWTNFKKPQFLPERWCKMHKRWGLRFESSNGSLRLRSLAIFVFSARFIYSPKLGKYSHQWSFADTLLEMSPYEKWLPAINKNAKLLLLLCTS